MYIFAIFSGPFRSGSRGVQVTAASSYRENAAGTLLPELPPADPKHPSDPFALGCGPETALPEWSSNAEEMYSPSSGISEGKTERGSQRHCPVSHACD